MYVINVNGNSLDIGRQGENQATKFVFDLKDWVTTFGQGTATLVNQRPNDSAGYPCVTTFSEGILTWEVKAADTAQLGYGQLQLTYTIGTQIVKSKIFTTRILESLDPTATPPAPWQSWVDEVIAAKEEIEEALEDYRTAAEQDIIDATKLSDAPSDNKTYGRKNGAWTEVQGGSSTTYVHTQSTPIDTWVVTHNMNKYPSVSVVDSADNIVGGDVKYNSSNQLTIYFQGAFSGKAYLN